MADEQAAALQLTLHPLVIINVSDHFTRMRCQNNGGAPRVFGVLIGVVMGRHIEIANSFEVKVVDGGSGAPAGQVGPELANLRTRLEQYKKTFPKYEMLGWYSTAEKLQDSDLAIHQGLCELVDSLLCLTLDPVLALAGGARELPITIYESEVHVVDEKPIMQFVPVPYKIDSIESERIAVDHIAHILPTGDSSTGSAFSQHLGTQYTAMTMLAERIDVITRYVAAVSSGQVVPDHTILRDVKSLAARLPVLDTPNFGDESMRDFNNTLLVTYLGSITKGIGMVNDVVDKYNLAYDKVSRRRGIF
jgi:COP9 signalosome complex subunit 6